MTTTVFRKIGQNATIASDSRSSWIDANGYIKKWVDTPNYKKTIMLDGAMYGFAGTNVIFKIFLEIYNSNPNAKNEAEEILDTVVEFAKLNQIQFMIIRHDEKGLKMFAYSPAHPLRGVPELYKVSTDSIIDTDIYAIGSGKESKMYVKHHQNKQPTVPIYKIISTNKSALTKKRFRELVKSVDGGKQLSVLESKELHTACNQKGGDLFTGGVVNMCKSATKKEIQDQIVLMDRMDSLAKAAGAVCASPINAIREKQHLEALGQTAVSKQKAQIDAKKLDWMKTMQSRLDASI